ncbi:predicted protein [Sclerotinia sclerotiorum 1980 UF-70]|uniref:Uncharacterized protein n=1 Tax=Sclerotinia sclerotiorum (strain ATCC 18683 / 1980 / Ss-1) TaxID=665079 RepID=A7EZZ9_SCLS1|nr:predicted protein [Sclerotinia sclerotiorum 1980 UF-70]EDN95041.1 predicted protein [Sclerotinia sclerotiorum 1980 UF-70]
MSMLVSSEVDLGLQGDYPAVKNEAIGELVNDVY